MKLRATLFATAAIAVTLGISSPALADQTATTTISQIKVLESSDARYKLFHGAIWLQADKATNNYRWGGKHCAGARLSDVSLHILFDAFREKHSVSLEYEVRQYKQQTSRCITGFTVTR